MAGDDDPVYALNFYSPMVADQLRSHRKTATIRLGDKSRKYRKGMVVQVLVGSRYSPREKVFDAVIDKVEVKTLADLSPREIEHDNPEIRRPEDMAHFLGQLYNREVSGDDIVTVIRFSEIKTPQHLRRNPAASLTYFESDDIAVIAHGDASVITPEHAHWDEADKACVAVYESSASEWSPDTVYIWLEPTTMFAFARDSASVKPS